MQAASEPPCMSHSMVETSQIEGNTDKNRSLTTLRSAYDRSDQNPTGHTFSAPSNEHDNVNCNSLSEFPALVGHTDSEYPVVDSAEPVYPGMHSVPKTNAYSKRYSEPLSHQSNCDKQYTDVVRSEASSTGHQSAIPVITSCFRGKSFPASQTSESHGGFEHNGQRRWGNQPYRRRVTARRTRNKFQSLNSRSDRQIRNYASTVEMLSFNPGILFKKMIFHAERKIDLPLTLVRYNCLETINILKLGLKPFWMSLKVIPVTLQ